MSLNAYDLLNIVGKKVSGIVCKENPANSSVIQLFLMFDDKTHYELPIDKAGSVIPDDLHGETLLEAYLDSSGKTVIVKG